jgi:fructose-1,6-bisphosphatase/inositol monophosphatase family enzyme
VTVDPAPECLAGVANLSHSNWSALLAAVSHHGDELVTRQRLLVDGSQALPDFELAFERRLIRTLRKYLGDVSVLAEEHFSRTGRLIGGTRPMRILLDPLDGSRSYSAGSTRYAIAIAGLE